MPNEISVGHLGSPSHHYDHFPAFFFRVFGPNIAAAHISRRRADTPTVPAHAMDTQIGEPSSDFASPSLIHIMELFRWIRPERFIEHTHSRIFRFTRLQCKRTYIEMSLKFLPFLSTNHTIRTKIMRVPRTAYTEK